MISATQFTNTIELKPGYWMASFDSQNASRFIACPLGVVSCIGGAFSIADFVKVKEGGVSEDASTYPMDFGCGKSFEGIVCNECPDGHYLEWLGLDCNKCSGFAYILDFLLLLPIGLCVPLIISYILLPNMSMFSRISVLRYKLSRIQLVIALSSFFSRINLRSGLELCYPSPDFLNENNSSDAAGSVEKLTSPWNSRAYPYHNSDINSINSRVDIDNEARGVRNERYLQGLFNDELPSYEDVAVDETNAKMVLLYFYISKSFFVSLATINIMLFMIQMYTCLPWLFQADIDLADSEMSLLSSITEGLGRVAHTSIFRMSFLSECISSDWNVISIFQFAAVCNLAYVSYLYLQFLTWKSRIEYCHKIGISLDHVGSRCIQMPVTDHSDNTDGTLETKIALLIQQLRTYYFTLFLFFFILWAPGIVQLGIESIACIDVGSVFDSYLLQNNGVGIPEGSNLGSVFDSNRTDVSMFMTTTYIGKAVKWDTSIQCESNVYEWNYIFFWACNPLLAFLIIILVHLNSTVRKTQRLNRPESIITREARGVDTDNHRTHNVPIICLNYLLIREDVFSTIQPLRAFFDPYKESFWYWNALEIVKRTFVLGSSFIDNRIGRYLWVIVVLSVSLTATAVVKPYKMNSANILSLVADSIVLFMVVYMFILEKLHDVMYDIPELRYDINKVILHVIPLLAVIGMSGYIIYQLYFLRLVYLEIKASQIVIAASGKIDSEDSDDGAEDGSNDEKIFGLTRRYEIEPDAPLCGRNNIIDRNNNDSDNNWNNTNCDSYCSDGFPREDMGRIRGGISPGDSKEVRHVVSGPSSVSFYSSIDYNNDDNDDNNKENDDGDDHDDSNADNGTRGNEMHYDCENIP